MKTSAKMLAFIAIVNAVLLGVANLLVAIMRLIATIIVVITGQRDEASYLMYNVLLLIIYVALGYLLIQAIKNWRKVLSYVKGKMSDMKLSIKERLGGGDKTLKGDKKAERKSIARKTMDSIDPDRLRKFSHVAHLAGFDGLSRATGRVAAGSAFAKGLYSNVDKRKMKRVQSNMDIVSNYRVTANAKGKDQFEDANGHAITKESNPELYKRLKKNKDILLRKARDGHFIDPITKEAIDPKSIYTPVISRKELLKSLDSTPQDLRTSEWEKNRREVENEIDATNFMNLFYDTAVSGRADIKDFDTLFSKDGAELAARYLAANKQSIDKIKSGEFTDDDLSQMTGYEVNGLKHILVPEMGRDSDGNLKIDSISEMRWDKEHGLFEKTMDSQEVISAVTKNREQLQRISQQQAGSPYGVSDPYFKYDNDKVTMVEGATAFALANATRGETFPEGVTDASEIEQATRNRLYNYQDNVISKRAVEGYEPDGNDADNGIDVTRDKNNNITEIKREIQPDRASTTPEDNFVFSNSDLQSMMQESWIQGMNDDNKQYEYFDPTVQSKAINKYMDSMISSGDNEGFSDLVGISGMQLTPESAGMLPSIKESLMQVEEMKNNPNGLSDNMVSMYEQKVVSQKKEEFVNSMMKSWESGESLDGSDRSSTVDEAKEVYGSEVRSMFEDVFNQIQADVNDELRQQREEERRQQEEEERQQEQQENNQEQ